VINPARDKLMARTMRMPDEGELPDGAVRDLVDLLFYFYRQAHRPTLREISSRIEKSDLPGTASTETIRRMLRGKTVPANWTTMEAVLEVLSELAGRTAETRLTYGGEQLTRREHLDHLWQAALDNPTPRYAQREARYQPEPEPWEAGGIGGYSEEPPF
jgi:hypothetical protein